MSALTSIPPPSGDVGRRLAYLNSHYPALSHTFIEREIEAVRRQGIEVDTFSIRASPVQDLRSATMRAEAARTYVLLGGQTCDWVRAHGAAWSHSPKSCAATAWRALRSGEPTPRSRLWQGFYFGEAVLLHDQMRDRGLRHIHVHHANVSADVARLACHLGNSIDGPDSWTWSMTVHGSAEFENIRAWDLAAKIRQAQAISCISDFCRGQLVRLVEREHWDKISVVRMSVDPQRYVPPPSGRAHKGPMRGLAVGRLVTLKGFHVLIDSCARLRDQGTDVEVRIIGQGPDRAALQAHIDELGLHNLIHLVGPVGQDDILEHYQWADVYLMTSFMEGLPVVVMEAMATGLPVVATEVAAMSELVRDGENGTLIRMARVDELTQALADMAHDPDRRRRMGERGRDAVLAEFTPSTTGPAMADFLRHTLDTADRNGR